MTQKNGMDRALSASNAMRCEQALHSHCECRCQGALHGANRGLVSQLPRDDPHSPTSQCEVCNGSGKIRERRSQLRRQEDKTLNDPGLKQSFRTTNPGSLVPCPACDGSGRAVKKSTMKKLLELEKLQREGRWP